MNSNSVFSLRGRWFGEGGRIKIDSIFSHKIKAFNYDAEKKVLFVDFLSGTNQRYCSVSDDVYKQMIKSQDKNEYYSRYIFGKYQIM